MKVKNCARRTHEFKRSHQWPKHSPPETGRREVPDSITGRAYRPGPSEFYAIFFKNLINTD